MLNHCKPLSVVLACVCLVSTAQAEATNDVVAYKPGERAARPKTVTITDIHSNKVRYDENETAATMVTIVNGAAIKHSGKLIAVMRLDLDMEREIGRTNFALGPGEIQGWSLSYNVGPETYGRGIEVRFEDEKGTVLDRWQEFYAVAAEWFRVHQHTANAQMKNYKVDPWVTYRNQVHYFAGEATDCGMHTLSNVEQYASGQIPAWEFTREGRRNEMNYYRPLGVAHTYYQNAAFGGAVGYEIMRQHPEYVLYDDNGQFSVDPIYGGYPNPMELASPIELGPKRKVVKPYLDRKVKSWQHCNANFALEDVLRFQANCIETYAGENGFDGIYIDGNMGVWKGYGYDGQPNARSQEDYVRLNARNHRLFSEILKKANPNFGTWYNWSEKAAQYILDIGNTGYLGSGCGKGDKSDASIRAAADWKNVMFLHEMSPLTTDEGWISHPEQYLEGLAENRDYIVQKYGANALIGYAVLPFPQDEPGTNRWSWPTLNYFGAQLLATQNHVASWFVPSWRPTLQFMTRYSRFIWAPDIKTVPEAEKFVAVQTPEEVWWKRLVYKRKTAAGYDLIVHFVRKPPYAKWDVNWKDDPAPLEGVKLSVGIGEGKLDKAEALRPYYYEEDQQPVETTIKAELKNKSVLMTVPPFRYHTMVVVRVITP